MSADFTVSRDGAVLLVELCGKQDLLIGREPTSDLILSPPTISRAHACLYVHERRVWIRDLSSVNGVYINAARIAGDTPLRPCDQVALGPDCHLQVRLNQPSR